MIPAAATPDPDEILTLEELSLRLKLSAWTVRRLVKRKVLSPLRTGRFLRFHWPTVKVRLGATPQEAEPQPFSGLSPQTRNHQPRKERRWQS